MNETVVRQCLRSLSFDGDYHGAAGCFLAIRDGNNEQMRILTCETDTERYGDDMKQCLFKKGSEPVEPVPGEDPVFHPGRENDGT